MGIIKKIREASLKTPEQETTKDLVIYALIFLIISIIGVAAIIAWIHFSK